MRGIHRSPVKSSHEGQWRGGLMFSLISAWINGWVNNREAWSIETLSRSLPSHCTDILIRIYIHIYCTSTISFHDNSETWTNHHGCTGRLCIDGWVQNFSISNALAMEILHHDKQRITPSLTTSYTIYDTLTNGYFKWHSMTLRWRTWLRYNEMDLRSCRLTKITQAPRADVGTDFK